MAKILIYTTPARGHLYPILDVALALAGRGHHVTVRTLASEVPFVMAAGLRAAPIDGAIEARQLDDWGSRSPIESAKRAFRTFLDRAPLEMEELRTALATEPFDLLLVDTHAWGAQALAEASGLPWATWHPYPFPPSRDAPPFGPGLPPAKGVFGRVRDALVRPIALGPLRSFLPAVNAARARAGAPALADVTNLFHRAPVVLLRTAEPFEYPRSDWPTNVHLVGPGLWSPVAATDLALPSDKPAVLVTCSTEFQDDGALIEAALGAFGNDPTVQLVCTTAGVDPARFTAPPGVMIRRFVPHAAVLPRAAVVVAHGGMGITQRALAAGVPVCVVPWGRDQLEVGRRAEACGAGVVLPRGRLSAARLRTAAQRARALSAGATQIRDAFAAAGGAHRATELVCGLLR